MIDWVKTNESFNNIVIHQNYAIMKLSPIIETKSKLLESIRKIFDEKFIEATTKGTQFVQRKSKLQGLIFFSLRFYS